jgi:hypothetical protein
MAKKRHVPTTKKKDKLHAAKKRKRMSGISERVKSGEVSITPHPNTENWWTWRSSQGRDKIFTSPKAMHDAMHEYFIATQSRPYKREEWKSTKFGLKKVSIDIIPPYTWESMCLYLGVSLSYFRTFKCTLRKENPATPEFLAVLEMADHVIRSQKYEGAAVGKYKENLISYDLGLKKDTVQATNEGGLVINIEHSRTKRVVEDVKRQLDEIDKEYDGKEKEKE